MRALRGRVRTGWAPFDRAGRRARRDRARSTGTSSACSALDVVDVRARSARGGCSVVVDGCASVGGSRVPRLLESLGAQRVRARLRARRRVHARARAAAGAPRRAGRRRCARRRGLRRRGRSGCRPRGVRGRPGVPLGEEYTVALGTAVVLEQHSGPVVTNLSTSRILDAVCARAGVPLHRTAGRRGPRRRGPARRGRGGRRRGQWRHDPAGGALRARRAGGGGAGRATCSPRRRDACATLRTFCRGCT